MEEEDNTQSVQSPGDSLSSSSPPNDVTVASATKLPLSSESPLGSVVHTPPVTVTVNKNGRIGGGGGGGRDDCWSEEATKVLIDAWGDRFAEPGRGALKQQQWHQVAEVVNSSGQCKYLKTDVQCKNRIDTVKKKYKQEKTKFASGDGPSKWAFFKKLEALIGGSGGSKSPPMNQMRWHFRKPSASETESESEHSAESLPPPPWQPGAKRLKMGEAGGGGVGEVAKAILGFTEAYEKAETAKLKLMLELEEERMKFAKEMELQRMQFLKTQMEIRQNDQEEERSKRGETSVIMEDDELSVKNNGVLSS